MKKGTQGYRCQFPSVTPVLSNNMIDATRYFKDESSLALDRRHLIQGYPSLEFQPWGIGILHRSYVIFF